MKRKEWVNYPIELLETVDIENMNELHIYGQKCLDRGFEGVILRNPSSKYKNGRATAKEGEIINVKRCCCNQCIWLYRFCNLRGCQ